MADQFTRDESLLAVRKVTGDISALEDIYPCNDENIIGWMMFIDRLQNFAEGMRQAAVAHLLGRVEEKGPGKIIVPH
jgi:hypothetical protein